MLTEPKTQDLEPSSLFKQIQSGMTLPQAFYTSEAVFKQDLEHIFYKVWLFAGHSCEVKEAGDYIVVEVGQESVIVVRARDGKLYAHFNVCRHRGARIVSESCGHAAALVCPYHQWAYTLTGELSGARLMGDDFSKGDYTLHSAHVREVGGLIFVSLADTPPDFEPAYEALAPQLRLHRLQDAQIVSRHSYEVTANWKTVVENNRECYHCTVTHPEFCLSNYDLGLPGDTRQDAEFDRELAAARHYWNSLGLAAEEVNFPGGQWFRISRFPLKPGYITESMDGQLTGPLMGELPEANVGSLRIIGLPNLWAHANPDYFSSTQLIPLAPDRTKLVVTFMNRAGAKADTDYDLQRMENVLRATAEEDWELCELNYAGIRSKAYVPGPLSPIAETSVGGFHEWYLSKVAPL